MAEDADLEDYYSIPVDDVQASVYENRKIRDLADRIRRTRNEGRVRNVHIIAGRNGQASRIAYLVARGLEDHETRVVPVRDFEQDYADPAEKDAYAVYLLDENALTADGNHTADDLKKLVGSTGSGRPHAVLLSLNQDTYERHFQDFPDYSNEPSARRVKPGKAKAETIPHPPDRKYWYAFIPLALSLIISPVLPMVTPFQQSIGTMQSLATYSLLAAEAVLTIAGLASFAQLTIRSPGHRRSSVSGGVLFAISVLLPAFLFALNAITPFENYSFLMVPGGIMLRQSALMFLAFQGIAAVSFFLIPYSYSGRAIRGGMLMSLILSILFLLAYSAPFLMPVPSQSVFPGALAIGSPFIAPYGTLFFGFLYNPVLMGGASFLASFASQWLMASMYVAAALSLRAPPGPQLDEQDIRKDAEAA